MQNKNKIILKMGISSEHDTVIKYFTQIPKFTGPDICNNNNGRTTTGKIGLHVSPFTVDQIHAVALLKFYKSDVKKKLFFFIYTVNGYRWHSIHGVGVPYRYRRITKSIPTLNENVKKTCTV